MLPIKFAYLPELIQKQDGSEQCFEEAKASALHSKWNKEKNEHSNPVDCLSIPKNSVINQACGSVEGELSRRLQTPKRELPLEAFMVNQYAQRLMHERQEEWIDWGDTFTSAELYIQQVCHQKNTKIFNITPNVAVLTETEYNLPLSPIYPDNAYVNRRREGISFKVPPLGASDSSVNVSSSSKRLSLETSIPNTLTPATNPRISTISALPGDKRRSPSLATGDVTHTLDRTGCHYIDVFSFFGETKENIDIINEASPQSLATQLFSTEQMREILFKQGLSQGNLGGKIVDNENEVYVNPWSSKFINLFWIKVATRMTNWSNYFICQTIKPPKNVFLFGHQQYGVEKRLGAGAFGTVYLVRLTTVLEPGRWMEGSASQMNTSVVSPELAKLVGHSQTGIERIVKLQIPDFPLEFYHMREVRRRLTTAFTTGKTTLDVRPSICPALALTYNPGIFSCLLMPYYPIGLLEWINYDIQQSNKGRSKYPRSTSSSAIITNKNNCPPKFDRFDDELVTLYLTLELLWIVEGLHKHAGVIHGDIKPDNFRMNDRFPLLDVSALDIDQENSPEGMTNFSCCLMSGQSTKVLVLIDFGMCIDMARFPKDTTFRIEKDQSAKRSFPCIEMLTGRPWTYQLDLFNIAGVIYTIVFKRYMKVKCVKNVWQPEFFPNSSRNYRAKEVWRSIITSLLNVNSCDPEDYPDISVLKHECESFLMQHANEYNMAAEKANQILSILISNS